MTVLADQRIIELLVRQQRFDAEHQPPTREPMFKIVKIRLYTVAADVVVATVSREIDNRWIADPPVGKFGESHIAAIAYHRDRVRRTKIYSYSVHLQIVRDLKC